MSSIQFRDITGNPFGIGAPKTDNQNKYKILLVKNKFGEFYLKTNTQNHLKFFFMQKMIKIKN